jgi:hypothetical protein
MKTAIFLRMLLIGAAGAGVASADLSLIPSGAVTGAPGSTVGWGYDITNTTADWLETTNLTSPSFPFGVPNAVFDYPVIAPNSSVMELFSLSTLNNACTSLPCGIFDITLPLTLPPDTTFSGDFTVSTELFSTDPLTDPNAIDMGTGPDQTASFSLTEANSVITPEPQYYGILLASTLALIAWRTRRERKAAQRG